MDSTGLRRRWTAFDSRNLASSRNAAYFNKFKPGYFSYIGPGSEKTWNFEKYFDEKMKIEMNWQNKLRMCTLKGCI